MTPDEARKLASDVEERPNPYCSACGGTGEISRAHELISALRSLADQIKSNEKRIEGFQKSIVRLEALAEALVEKLRKQ